MGADGSSSRRTRRLHISHDGSESESEHSYSSDFDGPCHSRDSNCHSSDDDRGKKTRKRRITENHITEYLAKKAQKKAAKVANKLKNISGYANESNPFGDSNLNERFVWRKKIVRDIARGMPLDAYSLKAEKKRQRERMAEIENVKKRREDRAIVRAQHEEEMALLARKRGGAEFEDWEKKLEEEFHLHQSKVRSEIRLCEGRAKPIDALIKHLNLLDELNIVMINEPCMVFKGLSLKEMEELHEEIKLHLKLDRATPTHIEYWKALLVVCDWELHEARKQVALHRTRMYGERLPTELLAEERAGIHSSIEAYVNSLLHEKSYAELETPQSEIESKLWSDEAKVVEYWVVLLKRLHIFKAKASLKEIHAQLMQPKHLQGVGDGDHIHREYYWRTSKPIEEDRVDVEETQKADEEAPGSFSPESFHGGDNEKAIDLEEDEAILEKKRRAVLKAMEGDAMLGISNNDEMINVDSFHWWHDKYRLRKPKYSYRIHAGYEWNQYNRVRHDRDNPPPKIIQGYEFNIFYPDLIDKDKGDPYFTIQKDGDRTDTCIIRFHGGPPYEDIAFRIVNKEWEKGSKKGFKCSFDGKILHLCFNFKRYSYRR